MKNFILAIVAFSFLTAVNGTINPEPPERAGLTHTASNRIAAEVRGTMEAEAEEYRAKNPAPATATAVAVATPWVDDADDNFYKLYTPSTVTAVREASVGYSHRVNGSDIFKTRVHNAINDLNKHDASALLIRKAGHFTINENSSPCGETWTEGCALLGAHMLQIKNHSDPRWMKIVLIHEITHLSQGLSECVAINVEIDYMRSSDEYIGYELRSAIEERRAIVC